jgi:hypothetical protein
MRWNILSYPAEAAGAPVEVVVAVLVGTSLEARPFRLDCIPSLLVVVEAVKAIKPFPAEREQTLFLVSSHQVAAVVAEVLHLAQQMEVLVVVRLWEMRRLRRCLELAYLGKDITVEVLVTSRPTLVLVAEAVAQVK